jgi:hypothetical protein
MEWVVFGIVMIIFLGTGIITLLGVGNFMDVDDRWLKILVPGVLVECAIAGIFLFKQIDFKEQSASEFIQHLPIEIQKETPMDTRDTLISILNTNKQLLNELSRKDGMIEELNNQFKTLSVEVEEYIEVFYDLDVSFENPDADPEFRIVSDFESELNWNRISSAHRGRYSNAYPDLPFRIKPVHDSSLPQTAFLKPDHTKGDDYIETETLDSGWKEMITDLDDFKYLVRLRSSKYLQDNDQHASYQIVKFRVNS